MREFLIKRRVVWAALLVGFLFLNPSPSRAQSTPGYILKASALSNGGELTASPQYCLMSTLGQASPLGISSSDSFIHYAGLWHTLRLSRMLFLPLILRE